MANPQACPHCAHTLIRPMKERPHESERDIAWYECLACNRIWSTPKQQAMNFGSPQSEAGRKGAS